MVAATVDDHTTAMLGRFGRALSQVEHLQKRHHTQSLLWRLAFRCQILVHQPQFWFLPHPIQTKQPPSNAVAAVEVHVLRRLGITSPLSVNRVREPP